MSTFEKKIHVLDGGFATQLCKYVTDPVDGTPLWSASFLHTNPTAVVKTHMDFLKVDVDVLMTNTYQASIDGFVNHLGLTREESYKLIMKGVYLAKLARSHYESVHEVLGSPDREVLIAGAIGPYGSSLHDCSEYTGSYADHVNGKEMADWHRPRIKAMIEAGVDILAFETIPCQSEAEALVELLKEFPEMKAWLSFSCKDENKICHGESFQEVALKCWEMNPSQLLAVGVNCLNPKYVSPLLKNINADREEDQIPLIVYPNSGETYDLQKGWIDRDNCSPVETFVQEWLDLGVTYIGGCCRTYASDIVKIKEEVNNWQRKHSKSQNGYK